MSTTTSSTSTTSQPANTEWQVKHHQVVIVGGGSGGLTVAAKLCKGKLGASDIAVIEPSEKHYYQPMWTLVGGGAARREDTERDEAAVMPRGATWIKDAVETFEPEHNCVVTRSGRKVTYDVLIVAAGIQLNWDGIKGLKEAIGTREVCSNYAYEYVDYTWKTLQAFEGGTAIFTHPAGAIKCGGAPQKICYLADDHFRKRGIRDKCKVAFTIAKPVIFDVKKYADALLEVVDRKGIDVHYNSNLVEIRADEKLAVFESIDTGEQKTVPYDMIHVTPPMSAPDFIAKSPLADQAGWLDVDKHTLQHKQFENVFALGDCSSLPTSKTGAAIRKQAPVAAKNAGAFLQGKPLKEQYDGYTSCPLVTGYGKLVLAEFDYDKNPKETFPFNQAKERWSMYMLKRYVLPLLYWKGMLKGRA